MWRRLTRQLRAARWSDDVTQTDVALRIGSHRNSLQAWEMGTNNPQLRSFVAWADALGFDVVLRPRRSRTLMEER